MVYIRDIFTYLLPTVESMDISVDVVTSLVDIMSSLVDIVTSLGLKMMNCGLNPNRNTVFLFSEASRPAMETAQPLICMGTAGMRLLAHLH